MLKLTRITFENTPRIPGIRAGVMTEVETENPNPALLGWRLVVRGTSVLLVSPPGWTPQNQTQPQNRLADGPLVIHEIPRSHVYLHWSGAEADIDTITKGGRFESPPFGPVPPPMLTDSILGRLEVPPGQMGDA